MPWWQDRRNPAQPPLIHTQAGESKAAALARYRRGNPGVDTAAAVFVVPDSEQPGLLRMEPLEGQGARHYSGSR